MPKKDGIQVLETVLAMDPEVSFVLVTGHSSIERALDAVKKGVFSILHKPINSEDVELLVNKALQQEEFRSLLGVYEASRAVFSALDLQQLLTLVVQLASRILRASEVSVMLLEHDRMLQVAASSGPGDEPRRHARIALGERIAGRVALSREPVMIVGPLEQDSRFSGIARQRDVGSAIVYPLVIGGKVLGVLNLSRNGQSKPFVPADMRIVTIFASQLAQAIHNVKLYQDLQTKIEERDVAYRRLEEVKSQMLQSANLASLGELAAGLAHELNNPLTGVLGFTHFLLKNPAIQPELREDLQRIDLEARRCARIVKNLQLFARQGKPKFGSVNLKDVVDGVLGIARYNLVSRGIDLNCRICEPAPTIFGDSSLLQQVLTHLFSNAKDALEGRPEKNIFLEVSEDGDKAVVRMRDNGCGIPKAVFEKVFNPFFTTKPVGQGTGLGLSSSYGIVKQHGGSMKIDSVEGQGTEVTVVLPLYVADAKETSETEED